MGVLSKGESSGGACLPLSISLRNPERGVILKVPTARPLDMWQSNTAYSSQHLIELPVWEWTNYLGVGA